MVSFFKKFSKPAGPAWLPATVESINLFDHLDDQVMVLVNQEGEPFDNHLHICLTQESFDMQSQVYKVQGKMYALGIAGDYALRLSNVRSVILHGFPAGSVEIPLDNLETLRDVIDSFCVMYAFARGQLSQEKAYDILRHKTVFYLGEPFLGRKGSTFGFETILREEGRESVKLFLTAQSASRYNAHNHPITPVELESIKQFVSGQFQVILEPHRNYWVEF
ncbi:hypothetical protein ABID29_001537 [Streptococcus rupicaprae]|uniref:Uncharacterized protein n=1 Tax=Streptococcus rupicaprae TaxID=759619 RepID=A0ABV2FIM8_9STRE